MDATTTSPAPTAVPGRLPAATRLGPAELVVADLERSLAFYAGPLGLQVLTREDGRAEVGTASGTVLVLHEELGAARAGRSAGLYHVALLYPSREELARAGMRLVASRWGIQGASDHGTHEAIYLPDPDGNGLELAADRPPESWPDISDLEEIRPQPLDDRALLGLVAGEAPSPEAGPGLVVGHLHLHVNDLPAATAFYRDVLGFDVVVSIDSVTFVAAGGYHHHVGLNTWRGAGIPAQPEHGVVGLARGTVVVDTAEALEAVRERAVAAGVALEDVEGGFDLRDPAGIPLRVVAEAGA